MVEPVAIASRKRQEAVADARAQHRLHGIGEHEHGDDRAPERVAEHLDDVGVHERLAAGEADLAHRPASRVISSR